MPQPPLSPPDYPDAPEADWSDLELVCEALSNALATDELTVRSKREGTRCQYVDGKPVFTPVTYPALNGGAALLKALRDRDFATFGQILFDAVDAQLAEVAAEQQEKETADARADAAISAYEDRNDGY